MKIIADTNINFSDYKTEDLACTKSFLTSTLLALSCVVP